MGDRRLLAHLGGADLPAIPQGEEFKVPRKIESFPRLEVKDRGEFATRGNAVLPDRFMGAPEGMGSAMPECSVVGEGITEWCQWRTLIQLLRFENGTCPCVKSSRLFRTEFIAAGPNHWNGPDWEPRAVMPSKSIGLMARSRCWESIKGWMAELENPETANCSRLVSLERRMHSCGALRKRDPATVFVRGRFGAWRPPSGAVSC